MSKLSLQDALKKIEELKIANLKLEADNNRLREKIKRKNKRETIKTTKKQIIEYWGSVQDECGLSVDWAEANERCWRCAEKKPLQRCHIIPDSLGGKDEPSNLVLLCNRCHIEAPNVEDKNFMWDWIRAYGTPLYDTFWKIRGQKEYEFIYKKSFLKELKDRDIISSSDFRRFWNTDIGKTSTHYAHPWYNTSTDAGVLKMRLDAYDKKYGHLKVKRFDNVVWNVCEIAKIYKWNVWQGSSSNLFSITLSHPNLCKVDKSISIRLCKGNIYKASLKREYNANNIKAAEYNIEMENDIEKIKEFIIKEIKKVDIKSSKQEFVFTENPIYKC